MKKTIIISERALHKLIKTRAMINEALKNDKKLNVDNAFREHSLLFNKYKALPTDIFKNNAIETSFGDGESTFDEINYQAAIKSKMDDIVHLIYGTYEKISHNIGSIFKEATNDNFSNSEKPTFLTKADKRRKWMHPATFFVDKDILKGVNDAFLKTCRCYYMMIMNVYQNGIPVWTNLFFNPKYEDAKQVFIRCNQISAGKLPRIAVGIADASGNYPAGTINYIRKLRYEKALELGKPIEFKPLEFDFQPSTFEQSQYADLIPKEEKSTIMRWYISAKNGQTDINEKYFVKDKVVKKKKPKWMK